MPARTLSARLREFKRAARNPRLLPPRYAGCRVVRARLRCCNRRVAAIAFDTLKLAKRLEAAGFAPAQAGATAEALADSIREAVGDTLVTRDYLDAQLAVRLAELKTELSDRMAAGENALGARMAAMEIALTGKIADSKVETMRWGVGFLLGQTALLAALIKLL